MKTLYIVGGTMGVGKTTVCQRLKSMLDRCAFLDGDWCWDMHPFQVTDETKALVTDNICHHLNSFLHCTAFENVVFCWVLHQQEIIDDIFSRLDTSGWRVVNISLVCTPEALKKRLQREVNVGIRTGDVIERSLARIPMYKALNTIKLDASIKSVDELAMEIMEL